MKKAITDRWLDAQKLHRENPKTFDAPSEEELANIRKGDSVRICNGRERFWVTVTCRHGSKIWGNVDNMLVDTTKYNVGDSVVFNTKHVYDI